MARSLSGSQRAILESLDRHVLVAAGAGSGKTFTVIRALLHQLGVPVDGLVGADPLPLDDIAAITFTTAAAADLIRGLRAALRDAGRQDLANRVDTARIGTIHGFCGDLLRGYGLRGERRLAGRIIEAGEASDLLAQAAHDTLIVAIEAGDLPGLPLLIGRRTIGQMEDWIATLATDGGRLDTIVAQLGETSTGPSEKSALVALAVRARASMDALLADVTAVDFDRLLTWTRDLLMDDGILAGVRSRIRLLLVDEFQDVDPVQRDIVMRLGAPASGDPRATRLMLVGDPKQSIYRFRRADVAVWAAVETAFRSVPEHARVLPLAESYRSVPDILAFVDATVGTSMDVQPADGVRAAFEVAYAPLEATRAAAPTGTPAVEIIAFRSPDATADTIRTADAKAVAERLSALHGSCLCEKSNPLRWSDMAILITSWAPASTYEEACRALSIPVYVVKSAGLLETQEVKDAILALRAIRDVRDRVAVTGVLRGPGIALRDDTLVALALADSIEAGDPAFALDPSEIERLKAGRALLQRLRALRDRIPTHVLLAHWLDQSGYAGHLALRGDEGARQALANLSAFARLLETDATMSIGAWLQRLRDQRARKDEVPPARVFGASEDVVTITSVHASKGLDWEVVVWADLQRKSLADTGHNGLFLGRNSIELKEPDVNEQPPDVELVKKQREREARAEKLRLRYVAPTRAKSRMIVSGIHLATAEKRDNAAASAIGSHAAWLTRLLDLTDSSESGTLEVTSRLEQPFPLRLDVLEIADAKASAPAEIMAAFGVTSSSDLLPHSQAIRRRVGRQRHSATALMLHGECERRYAWKYVLGLTEPDPRAVRGKSEDEPQRAGTGADARLVGTLTHEALARLDEREDVEEALQEILSEWTDDGNPVAAAINDSAVAAAREQIGRTLESSYGTLMRQAGAKRELRFLRILPDGAALEGAMDLVAPDGDGIAIVDVKTTRVTSGEEAGVADHYSRQRDVYADAVAAISQRAITRVDFLFPQTGLAVNTLDSAAREGLAARVRASVSAIEGAAPETAALARDASSCTWCGYRVAGWCEGAQRVVVDGSDEATA